MDKEWLQNVKPGDRVIVTGHRYGPDEIRKVAKVTPKQILIHVRDKIYSRYWKKDGYAVGRSPYGTQHLEKPTIETVLAIEEHQERSVLLHKISQISWSKLDTKTLHKVIELSRQKDQ